ncbi:MAG: CPXCG motif-containing cysteine-rich protein [Ignavibacteria bacterium]|nr:CPXCG motif-containing cysteine-rich protein [Ignavibacteria bacterium]
MNKEIFFTCPYCGEENTVDIDITAGSDQEFIQDCEVCCRPAEIKLTIDRDGGISVETKNDEGF